MRIRTIYRTALADRIAVAASKFLKFLTHRLDHFVPTRDFFQRLGVVFPQSRQTRPAATCAAGRGIDDQALALDILRPVFRTGRLRVNERTLEALAAAACTATSSSVAATFPCIPMNNAIRPVSHARFPADCASRSRTTNKAVAPVHARPSTFGQMNRPLLQPTGKKARAQAIMPDDLQNIRSAAPGDEEMP